MMNFTPSKVPNLWRGEKIDTKPLKTNLMKKILLVFSLLILFSISKAQQPYVPFPTAVNTVWSEGAAGWYTYNQIQPCYSQQIYIAKDTVISGVTYHQLDFYKHDRSGPIGCLAPWQQGTITTGTYGYFRNDSINKKVWLRFPGTSQDTLMYDFNLTLGDTLPPFMFRPDTHIRVTQIDTITLASKARKRYLLSGITMCFGDTASYLIEGIGGTSGFTLGIISGFCAGYGNGLGCMKTNRTTVYPDSSAICNLITSLDEVSQGKQQITIYPNPTSGQITVPPVEGLEHILIYNIKGQLVMETQTNRSSETLINLEGSSGMYFIRFQMQDGSVSSLKVVKQ